MTLTFQQAITQLNQWNQAGTPATNAQLDNLISQLSVSLSGTTSTVLYSGPLGHPGNSSIWSSDLAIALARQSGGKIGIINDTVAAKVISSNDFRNALLRANENDPGRVDSRLRSVPGGIWDSTSARFASQLSGPVVSVVPFSDLTRTWSQTELREVLNNSNVSSVNGITRASLLQQYDSIKATRGESAAFGELRDHLVNKSFLDGITSDLKISADGQAVSIGERFFRSNGIPDVGALSAPSGIAMNRYISSYGGITRDVFDSIRSSASWLLDLNGSGAKYIGNTVGTAVKYLGPVGDILDGTLSAARAYDFYQSGNPQGAFAELAGFAGGLAGGFWAGGTGIAIAGMLGLSGPVGWGLAAALAIGGGLGGEALARWGANGLADLFNDLGGWLSGVDSNFVDALRNQLRRLIDPIVLDLDGNGIELTPRATSNISFDMDGDGIKELTGWVKPTDGLLAIDSNANGQIDNINELIGDLGRSGFAELITYDLNNDRTINSNDTIWPQFRIWLDSNSNGITDTGELRTLASLNIRSIDLRYTAVNFTAEGNRIHEQSIFEYTNGTTGLVADIWFDVSNVDTNSSVRLTGNLTVDNLPDIRGRGDVRSLRSVMLEDGALATLVTGFITQGTANLVNARNQAEQIIYRWAGVQSVDPSSRGGLFDGRKLAALEAFLGTPFTVQGVRNPNAQAIASLSASWNSLLDGILSRLLMSGPLGDAIVNSAVYVPEMDRLLTVQTPSELLLSFKNQAPIGDGLTVAGYWAAVLPLAREITQDIGGDPASSAFNTAVSVALRDSGLSPFSDLLSNGVIPLQPIPPLLPNAGAFRLTSGSDTLWLGQDRHAIYAAEGNDFVAVNPSWAQEQLIDGGSGDDQLFGGSSDDWIDGGVGADTMAGGGGNDTYTVDDLGDVVVEAPGAGDDHVRSSISFTLASDLEHLTLLGTAAINGNGNATSNRISGNSAANRLEGMAGNDTLDGGAGADTMVGGLGSDFYRVDDIGDIIIEIGKDSDTVEASINYTLAARLENLVLVGAALNGTGNSLNNRLNGNALNNILDGGIGSDQMEGGLGDDIYIVDHSSDWISEAANAGIDTVRASIAFTLGNNLENLELTGSLDVNGSGNSSDNHLTGNSGDNRLDGGSGADTMVGAAGDDTYVVDHSADVVTEAASAGLDNVETSLADYTLAANVENLQLFVNWIDSTNRNGIGNILSNVITGSHGMNTLSGLDGDDQLFGNNGNDTLLGGNGNDWLDGGIGDDRMEGGAGDDRYIVNSALDVVVEAAASGTDTVESSVSFILGANVRPPLSSGPNPLSNRFP